MTSALLLLGTLAACGTSEDERNPKEVVNEEKQGDQQTSGIVAGEIQSDLTVVDLADNPKFVYKLKNQTTKDYTFMFTSSQRYDYSLKNESGEEIVRLSAISSYLQALSDETLKPGEELIYEFNLVEELSVGEYSLDVWLTSSSTKKDYKKTVNFAVLD